MSQILNLIDRSHTNESVREDETQIVSLLGVPVVNTTTEIAINTIGSLIANELLFPATIYFCNAHTLNIASGNDEFRSALRSANYIFGDGTGVRWGARMRGVRMLDNVNGTDLTPKLLSTVSAKRRTYYMLGADPSTIRNAATVARDRFKDWDQVGFHHGFVQSESETSAVIERINMVCPDVLLVGMGNPIQELWIDQNRDRLNAKVCLAVGGLFDFWAGNFSRAPAWLRRIGHEWIWRLWQQPVNKFKRYVIGNPIFLARCLKSAGVERHRTKQAVHQSSAVPQPKQTPSLSVHTGHLSSDQESDHEPHH